MKFCQTLIAIILISVNSFGNAKEQSKKYTPYQFEPEFLRLIKDKIPMHMNKYYDDLVNFHVNEIAKGAENLELQIYDIKEESIDYDIDKLLSRPYADQIKELLVVWRHKHKNLIQKYDELYETLPCINTQLIQNQGGSFVNYADLMRNLMLTLAYETSLVRDSKMPSDLEADWLRLSNIITKAILCDQTLIGNIIQISNYGSLLKYLSPYDHLFSDKSYHTFMQHTVRVQDLQKMRKNINFQEQYATLTWLDKMYKVFKKFLQNQDKEIKNKFGDKALDQYLELIKSEDLDRENLFNLEKCIEAIDEFYRLTYYKEISTMQEYDNLEEKSKVNEFLMNWELTPESRKARETRLKEAFTLISKLKRFVGLGNEDQLRKDIDNLFGKVSLNYLISNADSYVHFFIDHERTIHTINLYHIKQFKYKNGRLPKISEIQNQLIPYSIKSVIPIIDHQNETFIYKSNEKEPDWAFKI